MLSFFTFEFLSSLSCNVKIIYVSPDMLLVLFEREDVCGVCFNVAVVLGCPFQASKLHYGIINRLSNQTSYRWQEELGVYWCLKKSISSCLP